MPMPGARSAATSHNCCGGIAAASACHDGTSMQSVHPAKGADCLCAAHSSSRAEATLPASQGLSTDTTVAAAQPLLDARVRSVQPGMVFALCDSSPPSSPLLLAAATGLRSPPAA
jgi:hypothetical protein